MTETIDKTRNARSENEFPWRGVRLFLISLMTCRPVLTDSSNNEIAPSFTTLQTKVFGFKNQDWRNDLEGELVLALLAAGEDIRLVDVPAVAGAIYNSRTDD